MEAGTFRQDLYCRLSTIPIQISLLRDRAEDLPVHALCFAMRVANELGKKIEGFSPDALRPLPEYQWPGNVRELQRGIERAVILTPDPIIEPNCLEGTRFGLAHSLNAPGPRDPKTEVLGNLTPSVETAAIGSAGANGVVAVKSGALVLEPLDVNEAERVLIGQGARGQWWASDQGGGVAWDERADVAQ